MSRNGVAVEPHDHVVNLYDHESHLVEDVCRFLGAGLATDEPVLVVATPDHLSSFAHQLQLSADLQAASRAERYVCLDAADTLAKFMAAGRPNQKRFVEIIGGLITDLGRRAGRPVRVYGEMVAVLWGDGDVVGAIQLERFWNELLRDHKFILYCAYPMDVLTDAGDLLGMREVCVHHSTVVAPRSYGPGIARDKPWELGEDAVAFYIPAPTALRAVRGFVKDVLTAWGKDALIADVSLVACELATNAISHAKSPFRVAIRAMDTGVRIAVDDLSPDPPILREPGRTATGGRGVILIAGLSNRWGVETGPRGKQIWAEIPCY